MSRHRRPGVLSHLRNAVTENDMLSRNAVFVERGSQSLFRPVVLNPNFVADDIHVGNRSVDPALVSPPDRNQ